MRILLIEDDDQMRRPLVDRLLAEEVETVYQATDFRSALDFIRDADGVLCDDAFPFIAGEPPFEIAWMGMRDAARALRKPFVLIAGDPDSWLEALHEDTRAFKKIHAAEAVADLVSSLRKKALANRASVLACRCSSLGGQHRACAITCSD